MSKRKSNKKGRRSSSGGSGKSQRGQGLLRGMRSGFRNVARSPSQPGTRGKRRPLRPLDVVIWVGLLGLVIYLLASRLS